MPELGRLLIGTVLDRPYVFVFLLCCLVGAVTKMGWVRAAVFGALAVAIALAAELSSTRNGFPFGLYGYAESTRGRELWISNVPIWRSLTFAFLSYLGFQLAVLLYSPLEVRRRDVQVLDTIEIRGSLRVLVTGAVLTTALDFLLDPLAIRGDAWVLGRTYDYAQGGLYFGVPLSSFGGWLIVAVLTIGIYQRVERRLLAPTPFLRSGQAHLPFGGLFEPIVCLVLVVLHLAATFWIGEALLAVIGIFVFGPLALVYGAHLVASANRATAAEREAHRRDFPRTRALS